MLHMALHMQPIFQQNLIIQPADSLTSFTPFGHIAVNPCSGTCRLGGNFHRNFRIVSQMMGVLARGLMGVGIGIKGLRTFCFNVKRS